MVKIGFNSKLKAMQCVAFLNNVYQVPAYILSVGLTDTVAAYLMVSSRWAQEVYINFNKFIELC